MDDTGTCTLTHMPLNIYTHLFIYALSWLPDSVLTIPISGFCAVMKHGAIKGHLPLSFLCWGGGSQHLSLEAQTVLSHAFPQVTRRGSRRNGFMV